MHAAGAVWVDAGVASCDDRADPINLEEQLDIKITCRACDRTYPLSMGTDPEGRAGHCPFCGEVLAFQYAGTFIETANRVMTLGQEFVRQLTLLSELTGGFAIDPESVLESVRDALAIQDSRISEPYRPGWPPAPSEPVA